MIEKGVLHLDQSKFEGMRKERKNERKSSFLLVFQYLNNESSMVKKRAGLRSKR